MKEFTTQTPHDLEASLAPQVTPTAQESADSHASQADEKFDTDEYLQLAAEIAPHQSDEERRFGLASMRYAAQFAKPIKAGLAQFSHLRRESLMPTPTETDDVPQSERIMAAVQKRATETRQARTSVVETEVDPQLVAQIEAEKAKLHEEQLSRELGQVAAGLVNRRSITSETPLFDETARDTYERRKATDAAEIAKNLKDVPRY